MPPLEWNARTQRWQSAETVDADDDLSPGPTPTLTADDIDTARERLIAGGNIGDIADDFDVSVSTIRKHARGDTTRTGMELPPIEHAETGWEPVETADPSARSEPDSGDTTAPNTPVPDSQPALDAGVRAHADPDEYHLLTDNDRPLCGLDTTLLLTYESNAADAGLTPCPDCRDRQKS